jgi:hypothetical protein
MAFRVRRHHTTSPSLSVFLGATLGSGAEWRRWLTLDLRLISNSPGSEENKLGREGRVQSFFIQPARGYREH